MDEISIGSLFTVLIILLIFSAFFSSAETGLMALNRYRLRHLANRGDKSATRVQKLLERPDRLIGVILIGNNLVNIYAATIATLIGSYYLGSTGIALAPIFLTVIVLIFAEVTPKTLAALYPERIAFPASILLKPLLTLIMPLVWLVNGISNGLLRLTGINPNKAPDDDLSPDELRTVVDEAGGLIPEKHQKMLLNILDLERITVEDIMIPRNELVAIDIDDDLDTIIGQLITSQHTRLPIYKGEINNIIGILHMRKASRLMVVDEINKAEIMQQTIEPYFVPEGTQLQQQLMNFQKGKRRLGIVVDEYGDVMGAITLEDILEEIVGEFTTDAAATNKDIHPQKDGSYLIDGSTHIREINRALQWTLPTQGPKTLNGLIIEQLEDIPKANITLKIDLYLVEIIQIKENLVKTARVTQAERTSSASNT